MSYKGLPLHITPGYGIPPDYGIFFTKSVRERTTNQYSKSIPFSGVYTFNGENSHVVQANPSIFDDPSNIK